MIQYQVAKKRWFYAASGNPRRKVGKA